MTDAIVTADWTHAEVMAAIHADSFRGGEAWGVDAMRLQLGLPGAFGLLEPCGGMILLRVVAGEAEVLTLAVARLVRRRGLATDLLAAAMRECGRRGAVSIVLEVSKDNDAARALYAAAGFRQVGVRRRYYRDGSDALILRAAIDVSSAGSAGW